MSPSPIEGEEPTQYFYTDIHRIIAPIFEQLHSVDKYHLSKVCKDFYKIYNEQFVMGHVSWLRTMHAKFELFGIPYHPVTTVADAKKLLRTVRIRLEAINATLPEAARWPTPCADLIGSTKDFERFLETALHSSLRQALGAYAKVPAIATLEESTAHIMEWLPTKEAQNMTSLYLSNKMLSVFPPAICKLKNLEFLSLSWNQIAALPQDIKLLSKLFALDLSGNFLTTFRPEMTQLLKLSVLNVARNQFTQIPDEITVLPVLSDLDLSGNPLGCVPFKIGRVHFIPTADGDRCFHFTGPEGSSLFLF